MRTKSEIRTPETRKKTDVRNLKDEGRSDSFEGGPTGNNSLLGRHSGFGFRNSFGSRFSAFGFQTYASTVPTILAVLILVCSCRVSGAEPTVLVYQKNGKGFVHDNLAASAAAIQELGKQNGFGVDVSTNPAVFVDETLQKYRALIFANSNNEAFEKDTQRAAFRRYIQGGGGFMGIHSSTGSEREWTYFQQMQGGKFLRHSPLQKFTINVLDLKHPATAHLAATWRWEDECYFFTNLNPRIQVLLAVDAKTLRDPELETGPGQKSNGVFPLAWYHEFGGGRVFYTSLGHKIEFYSDPVFRRHILGGIRWVLGDKTTPQTPLVP